MTKKRISTQYRKQMQNAILNEYMELTMGWEDRKRIIAQIKDFKNEHYNPNKGYEVYTPETCLKLARMQELLEKSEKHIELIQKRVWKIQEEFEKLDSIK
jgi:hypothetical protein